MGENSRISQYDAQVFHDAMIRRILVSVVALATLLVGGYWITDYLALGRATLPSGYQHSTQNVTPPPSYVVEEVVSGLHVPWSIVWTSSDHMLVAERPGRVRVVENGVLRAVPLAVFSVSTGGEEGLMGLAVDPDYPSNRFLYACYAYTKNAILVGRVVRLIDNGERATIEKILIDDIPSAQYHAGCRLAFGPDGMLYITTGDATDRMLAQKRDSFAGKILRMNPDGTVPHDNPFPGSLVWSFGHRNPQGIAFHPETGALYETEHGPSIFDGPAGGDEVNRIVKGGNYGWPLVSHKERREGTVAPLLVFTPAEAPASGAFYSGAKIPEWKNSFFFGALRGEGLIRIAFDPHDPDKVLEHEKVPGVSFGRIRAVAEGPDGFLYFSTSNRDGRGDPAPTDDRIFRIKPASETSNFIPR